MKIAISAKHISDRNIGPTYETRFYSECPVCRKKNAKIVYFCSDSWYFGNLKIGETFNCRECNAEFRKLSKFEDDEYFGICDIEIVTKNDITNI